MIEVKGDIGAYFSGGPIVVEGCNIVVEQPKVKDVLIFGESKFFTALELLSNTDRFTDEIKKDNSDFSEINSFQMLLEILRHPEFVTLQENLLMFFSMICPQYIVKIDKSGIKFMIHDEEQNKDVTRGMINQMTYENFGQTIKEMFSSETAVISSNMDYNVDKNNAQAVALEKKLREGREKAARAKGERRQTSEKASLLANMCSILSVAFGQTVDNFLNLTLFQLYNTFHRWLLKRQYDMYEQGILLNPWASSDDIKEDDIPKEWTGDFYNLSNNS